MMLSDVCLSALAYLPLGHLGHAPPMTCEKSRIGQKFNVRNVASIILHVSLLYPQENDKINALNTTEKRKRSFSALKFIKNYLRSTMTDDV